MSWQKSGGNGVKSGKNYDASASAYPSKSSSAFHNTFDANSYNTNYSNRSKDFTDSPYISPFEYRRNQFSDQFPSSNNNNGGSIYQRNSRSSYKQRKLQRMQSTNSSIYRRSLSAPRADPRPMSATSYRRTLSQQASNYRERSFKRSCSYLRGREQSLNCLFLPHSTVLASYYPVRNNCYFFTSH